MDITESSPYMFFDREKWALLRNKEPMTLSEDDLEILKGINEELSTDEVEKIYLPLTRLLGYYINANINRQAVIHKFLSSKESKAPYILTIAGSVSVGKSTTARLLQTLLSRWDPKLKVDLITTDGFLYPNAILEERKIMHRKGFPESYDIKRIVQFVSDVKSGKKNIKTPIYSHLVYDIIPNEYQIVDQPDILILEGLNVLQSGMDYPKNKPRVFVSDFVDFSIYVDADEKLLERWYISRFLKFRTGAFEDPNSYFHSYAKLPEDEAVSKAKTIWRNVNRKNLRNNILPTKVRASLILHKGENHEVDFVQLRK